MGVHVVEMIVEVETTEVRLIGGPGLENLIEMKSLKWEIVIVVMTDEMGARGEGIIGDLGLEWEIEIEEVLEIVVHQQMISPKGVNSQQMGMMENGKLSVNVNLIPLPQHVFVSNLSLNSCQKFLHFCRRTSIS